MPRRLLTHSILRSPMYLPSVASIFKMGRMGFSSGSLVADMMKKKNWVGVVRAYNRQPHSSQPHSNKRLSYTQIYINMKL